MSASQRDFPKHLVTLKWLHQSFFLFVSHFRTIRCKKKKKKLEYVQDSFCLAVIGIILSKEQWPANIKSNRQETNKVVEASLLCNAELIK